MTVPRRLLILGTRTFALEVADLVRDLPDFAIAGFVENLDESRCREPLDGLPVFWVDQLGDLAADHEAVCALSTTHRRRFTDQAEAAGVSFATIVHPTARVSTTATLGPGTIVSAGAIVAAHARLGRHVIVNRGALVGHHTTVGDWSTLGPGANIGGCSELASACYIGIGAVVLDRTRIGTQAVVGAGAVVTRDVAPRTQVVGVPARVVKEDIDGR